MRNTYFIVDVEADGPIPNPYSMICFGAVVLTPTLDKTFYGQCKPISDVFVPDALAVSGFSRDETLTFEDPNDTMKRFSD